MSEVFPWSRGKNKKRNKTTNPEVEVTRTKLGPYLDGGVVAAWVKDGDSKEYMVVIRVECPEVLALAMEVYRRVSLKGQFTHDKLFQAEEVTVGGFSDVAFAQISE